MAKIKFPLKMADDAQARTIEELREHFDLASVLRYYDNGKLVEWLADRYYDVEAEKIKTLEPSSKKFKRNLCEILAVPYLEVEADDVDLAKITAKNERYERLKQFTADDTILAAVDMVAFTQEDLADLLDKDAKLIYLCGERFRIPCSKGGVTYLGVNNPVVDVAKGYDKKEIVFKGVQGKNIPSETEADDVDLAKIAAKNERYERLKQFTADDTILAAVDMVAFTQEDLADLLDKDAKLIYLCGERFRIPCGKGGVTYIGVNNPVVDIPNYYNKQEIVFKGVQGKNIPDASMKSVYTSAPDSFEDLPNETVKKASKSGNTNPQRQHTSTVKRKTSSNFRLIVRFTVESDGIGSVGGVIDKGSIQINDEVMITRADGTWVKSIVLGLERPSNGTPFGLVPDTDLKFLDMGIWFFSQSIDYAEEGERVRLCLKDTKMRDFSRGDVVTKI